MNTDHFIEIYQRQAYAYQRMIDAEDVDGNLWPALNRLVDFSAQRVVDLGSGTGRLPRLLHRYAACGVALDLHAAMLHENQRQQRRHGFHWPLVQADLHNMPLTGSGAGVVVAGWAIGHFCDWYGDRWRMHVEQALHEMVRVALPGANLLILETLGTGVLNPAPPTTGLAAYYDLLEQEWGFKRSVVSTDYQFTAVEEAVDAMLFFFGEPLARDIRRYAWSRVPEWTGIWHLQLNAQKTESSESYP